MSRDIIIDLYNFGIEFVARQVWYDVNKEMIIEYNIELYNIKKHNMDECLDFIKKTPEWNQYNKELEYLSNKFDTCELFCEDIENCENKLIHIQLEFYEDLKNIINNRNHLFKLCKIVWIIYFLNNNVCSVLEQKNNEKMIF